MDSSFGLKQYQSGMIQWIEEHKASTRYTRIHFATDKSYLGEGQANRNKLFRVSFGNMADVNLNKKYKSSDYEERILLTFGDASPESWTVIRFVN